MSDRSKIVYYVATSLDGFICGPREDVSLFISEGSGVEKYLSDLKAFKTVIMGRKTYEFGYKFGLEAGQPAYPHMEHFIFSNSLELAVLHPQVHIEKLRLDRITAIRDDSPTDVYLCGGGQFAGWLLDHGLIDRLKVKINPIVLGDGVPVFGTSTASAVFELTENKVYDNGLQIASYDILRHPC
ncbi:MAG: dihydrofolate reductase family protein [Flavobacteriaceae bacterium]